MALSSMTGFARVDGQAGSARWHWEARAFNGKALEVRLRLPNGLEAFDAELRERAARHVRRGTVQLSLQLKDEQRSGAIRVNHAVLAELLRVGRDLATALGSPAPTIEGVLALPGVIEVGEPERDESEIAERNAAVMASADEMFARLTAMQRSEGTKLESLLKGQLAQISSLVAEAREGQGRVAALIRGRLAEQVARLIDTGLSLEPERLHQEAAILASRADIQEEIDRLAAHVEAAGELLESAEPVGRRLDFLAQEFNREANTLCSKAADTALIRTGIALKAVIDQFREQVQNVQ
jgi:uncharacterized protein (TIGR00255 family)